MDSNQFLSNIPKEILERSRRELLKIVDDIKEKAKIGVIGEKLGSEQKVVFTDGSNVVSERRGCGVAIFSSISISYNVSDEGFYVLDHSILGPEKTLLILLPRFNLVSRANSIMRGLEYLTSLSLSVKEADMVVFDGSYVTSLLEPRKTVRDIYLDIRSMLREAYGKDKYKGIMYKLVSVIDRELNKEIVNKLKPSKPLEFAEWFFSNYYKIFENIYETIQTETSISMKETLVSKIQNYLFLLIEQTFTATALANVLNTSYEKNLPTVWISKDTESRIITRTYKSISLSNDTVLMDFVLGPKTYLKVSEIADLSEVSADKFTIAQEEDINFIDRSYSIPMSLVSEIYLKFSEYEVVYGKLGGINSPTIQLTYPRNLLKKNGEDELDRVLIALLKTSKYGYPDPLRVVHQRSTLREKSIKIISDGLYRACKDKDEIMCALLRDSGRDLLI